MGICFGDEMGTNEKVYIVKQLPKKHIIVGNKKEIKYVVPIPTTQKEANVNILIDYIMHGVEHDLFPANYRHNGNRWSWGVGVSIPSDTLLTADVFAFDNKLKQYIGKAISYSKSLKGDYGNSCPPQLILNYGIDNGNGYFKLVLECYARDGDLIMNQRFVLSKNITRMFIRTIIEENNTFYDLYSTPATYEK